MSKWNLVGPLFIVLLAGLAVSVLVRQARGPALEGTAANASVGAPERSVRPLSINAGFVGTRFIISNLGSETLRELVVRVRVNSPGGPYELHMSRLGAGQTQHFDPSRLRREDSRAYNPNVESVRSITVMADTPSGRGSWTGSYQ